MESIENSSSENFLNTIYFHKYKPLKKLGEGSFGMIFMAENIQDKEQFALKFEERRGGQNLLESEAYVMSYLKGRIPMVKSYGYSGDYNILVMELMGKSLEDLLSTRPEKKFSIKTVCMLAIQMLTILEQVHSKHIIHRDIKPDNFVMGREDTSKFLYLLDFGLARKYRSSTTGLHYPMKNRKKLTGTARYASINALKGLEQSRRDDLEAVGYCLMYFLRGSLPWQGLPVKTKEDRYKKIMEKKQTTTAEELCSAFPSEFGEYVNYTCKLSYEEEPDYNYLRGLFKNVMIKSFTEFDYLYDWTIKSLVNNDIRKSVGNVGLLCDSNTTIMNQINNQMNNLNIHTGNPSFITNVDQIVINPFQSNANNNFTLETKKNNSSKTLNQNKEGNNQGTHYYFNPIPYNTATGNNKILNASPNNQIPTTNLNNYHSHNNCNKATSSNVTQKNDTLVTPLVPSVTPMPIQFMTNPSTYNNYNKSLPVNNSIINGINALPSIPINPTPSIKKSKKEKGCNIL